MKGSPVRYRSTGNGRDSYIVCDNGGFCKKDEALPRTGFQIGSSPSPNNKNKRNRMVVS